MRKGHYEIAWISSETVNTCDLALPETETLLQTVKLCKRHGIDAQLLDATGYRVGWVRHNGEWRLG